MARLAALAKALFYPTPLRVVDMIAESVTSITQPGARLLDLCAGEGEAAARLGAAWDLKTYGVELHEGRAAKSAAVLTQTLAGSYHQLRTTRNAFGVVFLNPPYDDCAPVVGDPASRQEMRFLTAATPLLAPHGLLVFIPPRKLLEDSNVQRWLTTRFYGIQVWQFPDPERAAFDQVVILGRRRVETGQQWWGSTLPTEDLPTLGETRYTTAGLDRTPLTFEESYAATFRFELEGENPYALAPGPDEGCYRTDQWKLLMGENGLRAFERPLVEPAAGHVALLLAAGALNGTEVLPGKIIKGSSEKFVAKGQDEEAGVAWERERIVSRFSVLDVRTGEIETWRADQDPEKTKEWFASSGRNLAEAVRRDHRALFDGNFAPFNYVGLNAPGILPGRTTPEILVAQKRVSAAVATCWRSHKSAVVSGEMGVGKSTVATVAGVLARLKKVVIVVPTHLVRKWLREVVTITGYAGRSARTISEVDAFFADDACRFLILSKEMAKLGARWAPAVVKANRSAKRSGNNADTETEVREVYSCPQCGNMPVDELGLPRDLEWFEKTKRTCGECRSPLWAACAISARGTKRWPLASYLSHRYPRRYSLVIDEAHQYAAADSDQSRAVQRLISGAKHVLAMTGTLYGGRASSIFHLLYKLSPEFRRMYRYKDRAKFVQDHGLLETTFDLKEYTSRYGYRRNTSGGRVREIPGVNPAMVGLLLGNTAFLKLRDLGCELPPFTESVELIAHDPEVATAASVMAEQAKSVLREHPKVLGQYLMACLGYPDCPERKERIVDPEDGTVVATAPAFDSAEWPKDARVVQIAAEEHVKGLKTLVFFSQTGKRTPIPRVKGHLEAAGLRVAVLSASVDPSEREEWLRRQDEFDVLLTNGRLVETGLDLLFATTIVQYGVEYSIPTLRQSTRRSWRLGQDKPVRVIYLGYSGTMQARAIDLIAKKARAAEMIDGDEIGGLGQHDESGHNFFLELAREAASDRPAPTFLVTATPLRAADEPF